MSIICSKNSGRLPFLGCPLYALHSITIGPFVVEHALLNTCTDSYRSIGPNPSIPSPILSGAAEQAPTAVQRPTPDLRIFWPSRTQRD